MNRFSRLIAAAALAAIVFGGMQAQAREKQKKHKKNEDLSANPLANVHSDQPDKVLFDKAMVAMKKGRYDISRLDLQTLLNTYPDSEYVMRAKLAVGDTWFKEGGSAALAQAEAEYHDFETFFPDAPEAAEAQMKVGDIYYEQMEKPDRDYTNALAAEREYRNMINQFPDSPLLPRAKQKLRNVQEVLAERETLVGDYYQGQENFPAAIARLQTVADTYPLYSGSDQVLISIGDCYEGEAHEVQIARRLPGAVRERLRALYLDKASKAYERVISRYPMAPHVEDARDRLVALNKPIPDPSQAAIAESDAEQRSEQPLRFTDRILGLIKRGPTVVEAVHVGEPTLNDPSRTIAPDITRQNIALFRDALSQGKPAASTPAALTAAPIPSNEPPRSDQPSEAPPVEMAPPASGTGMGVSIVAAPASDPNAVVPAVGPASTALPAAQSAASAPDQINEIKPGTNTGPAGTVKPGKRVKAPKADLGDESSSKKKKKKGLKKLNPF
ncbi:MAG: outer membrane protein assembly factor BamD [Terracidiphilus sp.]